MTYVVSLEAYTPSPRFPPVTTPWTQARWKEAATKTGTYAVLETQTFTDPDADPKTPKTRDLSTDKATLAAGWYIVEFIDAAGNVEPTRPVFNGANITPSLDQVADLIRTYVRDASGQLPAFTATSNPSAQDVERYIGHGLRRVRPKLGPIYLASGDYEELADDATHAVALYAAAMVVLARTSQSQSGSTEHYKALKDLFDEAMVDLDKASEEIGAGEQIGAVDDRPRVIASFPGSAIRWESEAY